ncbi:NAD-dependent epimerase/dehydratase family protein [Terriglobus saanensis]|uniref:NAD-dependent epimerase/dehydratase n=1 Tax=Terriglobus saanensis (strain ATCC BAA-1853 / DSM 23119 / SP1PR4) TaxID=401053 RepID=E8UYH5_TERSS|nr:NAD-dependent epimerase/dehydratase family protein [Terriglobus saanensis]ADV82063.1 NAD-dependent epimerase/dehydratase [Terriglobus saanensis SP1PR4]
MRYLITGAQGFVGRYLTAAILERDAQAQVLGLGRSPRLDGCFSHALSGGALAKLPQEMDRSLDPRFCYRQISILDQDKIFAALEEFRPDVIFHLASGLRNDPPADLISNNIEGTAALMSAVEAIPGAKPKVVLGSTGGVYGRIDPGSFPLSESCLCDPADMYAITKLAAEQMARLSGRSSGMPVVVGRIFNIVGAGQSERHVCGNFAARLLALKASGGTRLEVGDVAATRDFVDARDVASALIVLAELGVADHVYNIASGVETSVGEVLQKLIRVVGFQGEWSSSAGSTGTDRVPRHWAKMTKLEELGFVPRHSLDASLTDLVRYYQMR